MTWVNEEMEDQPFGIPDVAISRAYTLGSGDPSSLWCKICYKDTVELPEPSALASANVEAFREARIEFLKKHSKCFLNGAEIAIEGAYQLLNQHRDWMTAYKRATELIEEQDS